MNDAERMDAIKKMGITIAIDGPAGSGKSTITRLVARTLHIDCLDTGAMYRALTWYILELGTDFDEREVVASAAADMPLRMDSNPINPRYYIGEVEVTTEIRESRISESVMRVSTNLLVREWMVRQQRKQMLDARRQGRGMIAEGRDITTVVCPDADVRILLLADANTRLKRRSQELFGDASPEHRAAILPQIEGRDTADATVAAFLEPAPGVEVIDSSLMEIEDVVNAVIALVDQNLTARAQ